MKSQSQVYVLELADSCWYVGLTRNFKARMAQHFNGEGAKWTRLHKPIRVKEVRDGGDDDEKALTIKYMQEYGYEAVRGYSWCNTAGKYGPGGATPASLYPYLIQHSNHAHCIPYPVSRVSTAPILWASDHTSSRKRQPVPATFDCYTFSVTT